MKASVEEAREVVAYIALGSNLGDRTKTIDAAVATIDALPGTRVLRRSRLIETAPIGPPGQGPYRNGALEVATTMRPRELLAALLEIELSLGRDRGVGERNGPRTIDLDLLLHGDTVVDEPGLQVPHPRLHERAFVLVPLCELAGDLLHPTLGNRLESLLACLQSE